MSEHSYLSVEGDGDVIGVTIERPERRNALNDAALEEFAELLRSAAADGVAGLVIAGRGEKAFSAGSDIKELAGQTLPERIAHTDLGQEVAERLEKFPGLVTAAIEGYCLGGGLELALACDRRVVAQGSLLGLPEVEIGALPSWGGTYRLPRVVGITRAKQIILFGRRLDADESLAWGLASEVVPTGQAYERALASTRELLAGSSADGATRLKELLGAYPVDAPTARRLQRLSGEAGLAASAFAERRSEPSGA